MQRDHAGRFVRADGMANVLTGLGDVFRDKAMGTRLLANADLTQNQIDALYHDDGLAAKIVDMPANDLTREGFEILAHRAVEPPRIDGVLGTVELIGMRSTRIRAADGSLITVTNSELADKVIKNVSRRVSRPNSGTAAGNP